MGVLEFFGSEAFAILLGVILTYASGLGLLYLLSKGKEIWHIGIVFALCCMYTLLWVGKVI